LSAPASAAEIRASAQAGAAHSVRVVALGPVERDHLDRLGAEALAAVLQVFTGPGLPEADQPAIAGATFLTPEGLEFRPLFPFVSGVVYTAHYQPASGPALRRSFEAEAPGGEPPRIVGVFPSSARLPENTLRLYLHFSRPMEARDVQRHVHLLDGSGREVPLAFVEIEHGLWDGSHSRLTLLFHPGRLKRGVAPGERLGPPLRAGSSYRLVVDARLRDAEGRPLGRPFEHAFAAAAADRASPHAEGLVLHAPASAGEPLMVDLPEPLDEALLQRLLWVEDSAGEPVAGGVVIARGETLWSFAPSAGWIPGSYSLRLHPALEDRAGNRFDRLFDRELAAGGVAEALVPSRFAFVVKP
jgi:hypothetical protein